MSSGSPLSRAAAEAAVVATVTAALLGFRTFGADHYQYLLHARRDLDPSFLRNDWFVEQTEAYHYTFSFLAEQAMALGGLQWYLLAWTLLTSLAFGVGVVWLVRAAGGTRSAVAVAAAVALAAGQIRGWGDLQLLSPQALPHFLGTALAIVVLAATVARSPRGVAVSLLATTYVHVNVGMWMGLVVAAWIAFDRAPWRSLRWRPALAGFVVGVSPLAVLVLGDFGGADVPPGTFETLFRGRAPHHYLPLTAPAESHLVMGVLLAGVIVLLLVDPPHRRPLAAVAAAASVAMAIALAAGSPLIDWPLPVRLFPFRLVPILMLLTVALLAVTAARDRRSAAWLMVGAFAASAASMPLALLLAATAVVMSGLPRTTTIPQPPTAYATLVVLAVAGWSAWTTYVPTHPGFDPSLPEPPALATALAGSTSPGEVVLTDPAVSGLRWYAERAIVVDFKVFPLDGRGMSEWRQRMRAVTGIDPAEPGDVADRRTLAHAYASAYNRRSLDELDRVAAVYGADAILVAADSVAAGQARAAGRQPTELGAGYVLIRDGGPGGDA